MSLKNWSRIKQQNEPEVKLETLTKMPISNSTIYLCVAAIIIAMSLRNPRNQSFVSPVHKI